MVILLMMVYYSREVNKSKLKYKHMFLEEE